MSEPLPDTWHRRDLPVLRAVVRRYDETGEPVKIKTVVDDTGLAAEDVQRAARALADAYLVDTWKLHGGYAAFFKKVSAEARQLAGSWPSPDNGADRLIAALEKLVREAPTEDERTRAQKVLDFFTGAGRDIAVSVATSVITGAVT
jgi:hypothetical protein